MKLSRNIIHILFGIFIISSCQKELSLETGVPFGAQLLGSLKDSTGNCLPIIVRGTYKVDSTLTDSNYVLIQLNVTTPGNYTIMSDNLNGFFFKDSGFIATTGLKTIKLKASGKPASAIESVFTIGFGSAFCSFSVEATGTGSSGGGGSTPIINGDYFPTIPNSNWTYRFDLTGDTLRFTADVTNITIGTFSYRKFIAKDSFSTDTLYYRKAGGLYYEFGDIDFLGVLDSVYNAIDFIFLKDNQSVGGTWESSEVGAIANKVTGTAKLKFTVTGMNVKKTISGSSVDSIIVLKREIMFKPTNGNTFSSYSSMSINYAKGAGLLLIEGSLPPPFPPAPYRFEATRFKIF